MLTPDQIKKHTFRSAGKGLYRSEDVDAFFKEAAEAFIKTQEHEAELQKNNDELYQRVEALANALNQLRAERELIQKTMILAQKSADDINARAQEESAKVTHDAQREAERLRQESREESAKLLSTAKAEVEKLLLETQAQAENIQAQAKARAESLFDEARNKAQAELIRISGETQREQQALRQLRQESNRFRNHLLDAVARQMELIEQMPDQEVGDKTQESEGFQTPAPIQPPAKSLTFSSASLVPDKPEPESLPPASSLLPSEKPLPPSPQAPPSESPPSSTLRSPDNDMFAELEAALEQSEEGFQLKL